MLPAMRFVPKIPVVPAGGFDVTIVDCQELDSARLKFAASRLKSLVSAAASKLKSACVKFLGSGDAKLALRALSCVESGKFAMPDVTVTESRPQFETIDTAAPGAVLLTLIESSPALPSMLTELPAAMPVTFIVSFPFPPLTEMFTPGPM